TTEEEKTLSAWVEWLIYLCDTYFAATEEYAPLNEELRNFSRAALHFPTCLYTQEAMEFFLKEYLGCRHLTLNRHLCQAVRFCSMLPMRAIPAKVIYLLGMNHEAFPRKEELHALDLLKGISGCYSPSRVDFDRYLFLETVLSAREKWIVSYLGRNPYDLTEQPPSSVVSELLSYVSEKVISVHPSHEFSHVQITPRAFSIHSPKSFVPPIGHFRIETRSLRRLARSPLAHYLHAHQLSFFSEEFPEEEEPFTLSPLQKALFRKEALYKGVEEAQRRGERRGAFPLGALGSIARGQVHKELSALPTQILSTRILKPIQMEITPHLTVEITGAIEG
ncbi:MAG: exodeoxyribonuclease V subunit gamma, partial [Chlamydiia bacterium]|nr:exodeoxyribonuclease V subunit gamma [Chlamydiia bacterium]